MIDTISLRIYGVMPKRKKPIKFRFNIYLKENGVKTVDFNTTVYRVSLNSATNYVNRIYRGFCIERI